MRLALWAAALAAMLMAPAASAHDYKEKRGYGYHRHGDDDDRRGYGRYGHSDSYGYGYGEGYRYDRWRGEGHWRDQYGHRKGPPARVVIRVPVGGYFDYGYDRLIGDYYGRDCRRYSAWDSEWRRPYRIGYELPNDVSWRYVPSDLARRLPPPPYGHSYVNVDRDVLLVAEASKRVIDAVVILSGR
jgi:hypothetical protein